MTATIEPEVGKARLRKEDGRLITGRTRWTDNMSLPGMLHLATVRSPLAHAKITNIDTSAAKEMPGVVAVLTGADLDTEQSSMPCAMLVNATDTPPRPPPVAVDRVRFAGDIVAVVLARDAVTAKDATDAVDVDYEDLPVVLDMEAALD